MNGKDGGHFESTAAYELIHLVEVPFIIVSGAEADPKGNLDDVANPVRRVRLDFGAEIKFFDDAQWESYRKLGERIAASLFDPATPVSGKWSPHQFCRLTEPDPIPQQGAPNHVF